MITKKTLFYWTLCSIIMITGIHFLDGMPLIDDWFGFLEGVFLMVLILVVASIVLAVLMAAFPFKSNRTPNKQEVRAFIPASTITLTLISFIAFVTTRPSYAKSKAAESILCQSVKDGTFQLDEYIIERKGNLQTETSRTDKQKSTFTVNWISDCEYEVTNIMDSNDIAKVKIISVTKEVYRCVVIGGGRTTVHELKIQSNHRHF